PRPHGARWWKRKSKRHCVIWRFCNWIIVEQPFNYPIARLHNCSILRKTSAASPDHLPAQLPLAGHRSSKMAIFKSTMAGILAVLLLSLATALILPVMLRIRSGQAVGWDPTQLLRQ